MTSDNYRSRLIEAVRQSEQQQDVKQMTDDQLQALVAEGLGLPANARFTDEQLSMIIEHSERR